MKIHKWFRTEKQRWMIAFRIGYYHKPFNFVIGIELLCFSFGFFIYNKNDDI